MKKLKTILLFNKLTILVIIFSMIYVIFFTKIIKYETSYPINTSFISAKIINYSIDGNKASFELKGKERIKAYYYIKNISEKDYLNNNLCLGCTLNIDGSINKLSNNTIPNIFNYKKYAYNKKIFSSFKINEIEIIKNNSLIYKFKDILNKKIMKFDNNDYLKVFILGDKSLLNNDDYSNFQVNGTAHLLAISGMHIAFLVKILDLLLIKVKYNKKTLIITSILLFYLFLTNFSASILRATIFYIIFSIKKIFNINITNMQVLLITAFILIIFNPFIVYDIGFIYSFLICFGIIYNTNIIKGNYIKKLFIISIISFIYSLPITSSINYEINPVSILANLIFVPLVSLIIYPLALFTIIIPLLNPAFSTSINILKVLNNLFINISIPIIIPKISLIFIILFYLFLIIIKNIKLNVFIAIIFIIISIFLAKVHSEYKIMFLDVKQGDSTLITNPYNKETILIDTGGLTSFNDDVWKRKVKNYNLSNNYIKYFKSIGITKINYLILTHGDFDHMGEAINLVDNFKVEKVIFNCGEFNDLEKDLIKVLNKKKIPYYSCIKELNIDKNKLYFLQTKEYDNENDNSNVIYTEIDGYKFMFMGDAGIEKEKDILDKYNISNIDVLKVGHHGSKTSTSQEFINEITPKFSIISVGKNNRYGHPNKEILNNLETSKIYRTDNDGSIMFKIKNNKLKIETCTP